MYLPLSNATLIQEVDKDASSTSAADAGNLATPQGLYLMNRYYFIAYENGQDAEPLDEGSSEMVVKLILTRKTVAEGFTTINLAINPDTKLIRRIRAVTPSEEVFEFSFTQYILNTNIPDVRFHDGNVVACASAAVEQGYALIQNVIVNSQSRGIGIGEKLCRGLLAKIKELGAEHAYLQVVQTNEVANNLYAKLGFKKVYSYWYMMKGNS